MTASNRYQGKPLLRLVELYILWSIGQLDRDSKLSLEAMTPNLQRTYGRTGTWQEIIAAELGLPEAMPTHLRNLWIQNNVPDTEADEWVRQVADANFVG